MTEPTTTPRPYTTEDFVKWYAVKRLRERVKRLETRVNDQAMLIAGLISRLPEVYREGGDA